MIVYIAGPITGNRNYKAQFAEAQKILEGEGHIVLNPAILPQTIPNPKAMPICMAMIEQADAVYLLRGWTMSAGARTEWKYAEYLGKEIIVEEKREQATLDS